MIASFVLSFMEWDLVGSARWVGLNNIREMLHDPVLIGALKVTTLYALVSVPLNIVIGLGLALLLNTDIAGLRFYRTAFYLPSVLSGVAVALLWRWLFSTEFGLINLLLSYIGITGPSWLGDERRALWSLIIMNVWNVGAGTIIYLAGLQGIPTDLYEAGVTPPPADWEDKSFTFDAFLEMAQKLTKKSGDRTTQYGFLINRGWRPWPRECIRTAAPWCKKTTRAWQPQSPSPSRMPSRRSSSSRI